MRSKNTVHSRPNPAPDASNENSIALRPTRGIRRRTLTAFGVAMLLAGLLLGEGIQAVAQVFETPAEAATTQEEPTTSPFLSRTAATRKASRDAEARAAVSLAAFEAIHDVLLRLAPEGITAERRDVWRVLADCESGDWYRGVPVAGSRRWDTTEGFFEGGLQFHPGTWDAFRDPDMPASANEARPVTQMVVAERVLEAQGWRAWPVCSRKVGYR